MARFKKGLLLILITCICMTSLHMPLNVNAGNAVSPGFTFNVDYPRPHCDERSGYISIMYSSPSGYRLWTYFWTIQDLVEYTTDVGMKVKIGTDGVVSFTPQVYGDHYSNVTLCFFDYECDLSVAYSKSLHNPSSGSILTDYYNDSIVGIEFGGNIFLDCAQREFIAPTIHYNTELYAEKFLTCYYSLLNDTGILRGNSYEILDSLANIYNQNLSSYDKMCDLYDLLLQMHEEDNAQIIYIVEMIEYYLSCPDDSSLGANDNFDENSKKQKSKLDSLNEKSKKKKKVDAEDSSESVDEAINYDNTVDYGVTLSVLTGHEKIVTMLLITFSVGTIGYVLFGKRK